MSNTKIPYTVTIAVHKDDTTVTEWFQFRCGESNLQVVAKQLPDIVSILARRYYDPVGSFVREFERVDNI